MKSRTPKNGNFQLYIGNIYSIELSFFDKIEKTKYIPCIISTGVSHEKAIRPLCITFYSIREGGLHRPLPSKRDKSRFPVRPFERNARYDFDYMA